MNPPALRTRASRAFGFTLIEVLLATAILGLLVAMFATLVAQTSGLWQRTTGKIEQFREARNAFESMTTRLSQATLNTYWDYDSATAPTKYERRSELRFISGPSKTVIPTVSGGRTRLTHSVFFIAPLGYTNQAAKFGNYDNLLCAAGYYLEFGDDKLLRPGFIPETVAPLRFRHRLMEFIAPTENASNNIYKYTSGLLAANTYNKKDWYQPLVNATPTTTAPANFHQIAENIVALIITPRLSRDDEKQASGGSVSDESKLASNYLYDSSPGAAVSGAQYNDPLLNPTNQLPPILQVTMVAIDELSASRLRLDAGKSDVFGAGAKFTKSSDYSKDLLQTGGTTSLEDTLIAQRVNYRIFNTNVTIRGAKWSRDQKN